MNLKVLGFGKYITDLQMQLVLESLCDITAHVPLTEPYFKIFWRQQILLRIKISENITDIKNRVSVMSAKCYLLNFWFARTIKEVLLGMREKLLCW